MTTTLHAPKHTSQINVSNPPPRPVSKDSEKSWDALVALNQNLAHAIDLRLRTKQAYWSAKGGSFYALHKMFDGFSDELDSISDELAARIMILGGVPAYTPSAVARSSKLPPAIEKVASADVLLESLVEAYKEAVKHLQPSIFRFIQIDDHVTARILTGYAKLLDEQLSFVAAHGRTEWLEQPRKTLVS